MRIPVRIFAALVALGALAVSGCEEAQHFMEPTKHQDIFVDFRNKILLGQQRIEYRATVLPEPDMKHPHFEGRWTFRDPEKPVDVYVIPASAYDPLRPLAEQTIFWSSVQDAIGGLGQLRHTSMHVHPTPQEWVIVFFNAAPPGFINRSEFSAEVQLTYFK